MALAPDIRLFYTEEETASKHILCELEALAIRQYLKHPFPTPLEITTGSVSLAD